MNDDRLTFRASLVATLCRVHGLSLAVAMGVLGDRDDAYDTGLPVDDVAHMIMNELRGPRRYAPR